MRQIVEKNPETLYRPAVRELIISHQITPSLRLPQHSPPSSYRQILALTLTLPQTRPLSRSITGIFMMPVVAIFRQLLERIPTFG
jgi:hypothetical protein